MAKPEKIEAICELVGGSVSIDGDKVIYEQDQTPPDSSAIDKKLAEMTAEWESQNYARNRKVEYDALNQFELISDDDANGTSTHKDAIAKIKSKWPKDNTGPKN